MRVNVQHDERVRRLCLARQEGRESVVDTVRAVGHGIRLRHWLFCFVWLLLLFYIWQTC